MSVEGNFSAPVYQKRHVGKRSLGILMEKDDLRLTNKPVTHIL